MEATLRTTHLSLTLLAALTWAPTFAEGQAMNQPAAEFGLYASSAKLPLYARDEAWRTFVERGPLEELLVSERDIEAYDWDHQALVLTPEASRRPRAIGSFIAVLGQERLYGGKGLHAISAMAVEHPVIYTERAGARTLLFLRARHDFFAPQAGLDPVRDAIASPAVRARFEALGKLRRPFSEPAFQKLRASVARIRVLGARATPEGLALEYELSGQRAGAYELREWLGLRWGRYGASFGPSRVERLELQPGTLRRLAVFPYRELGKYGPSRREAALAGTQDGRVPDPLWSLGVSLRPLPSEAENAVLGLVEALRLQPDRRGGSVLEDSQSAQLPVDWRTVP